VIFPHSDACCDLNLKSFCCVAERSEKHLEKSSQISRCYHHHHQVQMPPHPRVLLPSFTLEPPHTIPSCARKPKNRISTVASTRIGCLYSASPHNPQHPLRPSTPALDLYHPLPCTKHLLISSPLRYPHIFSRHHRATSLARRGRGHNGHQ
jgi:hypothetical protein